MNTTGVLPEALAARISRVSRSDIDAMRLSDMSFSSPCSPLWRSAGQWHHCRARPRGSPPWKSLVGSPKDTGHDIVREGPVPGATRSAVGTNCDHSLDRPLYLSVGWR